MVKRYWPTTMGYDVVVDEEHEKGRFVMYADYDELRAMCDELAEALDQELNFRGDASDFNLDKGFNALARYRVMAENEEDGE